MSKDVDVSKGRDRSPNGPSVKSSRRQSAALCAVALLGLGFLFFINPARTGWLPPCPFHALTGLDCPGCGSLRAIHSLLHLNGMQALAYNPLTCLCLPFLGIWWLWHARRAATGRASGIPFIRPLLLWSIVATIGFFGIYRNIMLTMPVPAPAVPQSAVMANLV